MDLRKKLQRLSPAIIGTRNQKPHVVSIHGYRAENQGPDYENILRRF